jgi:hypothetical protein
MVKNLIAVCLAATPHCHSEREYKNPGGLSLKNKGIRWILHCAYRAFRMTMKGRFYQENNDDTVGKKESKSQHCHSERSEESIPCLLFLTANRLNSSPRLRHDDEAQQFLIFFTSSRGPLLVLPESACAFACARKRRRQRTGQEISVNSREPSDFIII